MVSSVSFEFTWWFLTWWFHLRDRFACVFDCDCFQSLDLRSHVSVKKEDNWENWLSSARACACSLSLRLKVEEGRIRSLGQERKLMLYCRQTIYLHRIECRILDKSIRSVDWCSASMLILYTVTTVRAEHSYVLSSAKFHWLNVVGNQSCVSIDMLLSCDRIVHTVWSASIVILLYLVVCFRMTLL